MKNANAQLDLVNAVLCLLYYYYNTILCYSFIIRFSKNKIAIGFLWKSRNFWRVLPTRQDGFQNGEYGLLFKKTNVWKSPDAQGKYRCNDLEDQSLGRTACADPAWCQGLCSLPLGFVRLRDIRKNTITRHDLKRHDMTWRDLVWYYVTLCEVTLYDMTWHDVTWLTYIDTYMDDLILSF